MDDKVIACLPAARESDLARLAERIAGVVGAGDVLFLAGDLGAGKTCFARAFIRAYIGNPDEEVPSPTFSLVQQYEPCAGDAAPVWHFDLYRLERPEEIVELGLEEALTEGVALIEWPERLEGALDYIGIDGAAALTVRLGLTGAALRRVELVGCADWARRLAAVLDDEALRA